MPCLFMALPIGFAAFLLLWMFGLLGEDDPVRLTVICYGLGYALLHFLNDAGEYGDGPKTMVVLTSRCLVYRNYNSDAFERIGLADIRAVTVQRMDGSALVHFIRVEHAAKASGVMGFIDFVPLPKYRFDAQGNTPLCDEIMVMADAARAWMNGQGRQEGSIGRVECLHDLTASQVETTDSRASDP